MYELKVKEAYAQARILGLVGVAKFEFVTAYIAEEVAIMDEENKRTTDMMPSLWDACTTTHAVGIAG